MALFFRFDPAGLLGVIVLAIWLHIFFGRGWFWRLKKSDADRLTPQKPPSWPSVVAVVPARNEADNIARAVACLSHQDYAGKFSIVIVDDHSEDATASLVAQTARENGAEKRPQLVSAPDLPEGWTGKLWAMQTGVAASQAAQPAYFWFTDADVIHAPDTLSRLVSRAVQHHLDLASLMVLLQAATLPERALIPPFLYFFLMLYPPKWIADADLSTAGAAGGCILVKREALERIGGLAAIRSQVIDDCALARAVKQSGGRVWMGLTRRSVSLRGYSSFAEIRDLIARTAFTQLRYSSALLSGTIVGMLLTYIAPIALVFVHDATARLLGAVAWLLMTASFLPTVRFYRLSPAWALLLPFVALFYTWATWISAVRYWTGRGAQWKGRSQAQRRA
jgi:hopene-associated glycosyltransferase HpnB